ncbi:MAG: FAD:protein FMN transferase [Lentisphaeria bacterium]|jgi:thiamine biosynthesis lipoprotein|nr:FAD:protein FMN transferase [Lentisphaeria bacterium]MDP7743575.1 FAD:protein FMN transferase [Lentisphaeria bacterium]
MNEAPKTRPPLGKALFVLTALALVAGGLLWHNTRPQRNSGPYTAIEHVMGTRAGVTFWTDKDSGAHAASTVFAIFREIDEQFSNYKPDSELSKLNATAHQQPFQCTGRMWELLNAARTAWRASGGGFDISAGPLMHLWGFYTKRQELPSAEEIAAVTALVGLDKIVFDDDERTVFFPRQGMMLDTGGIAKGYAIDLAVAAVRELGIDRGVIDLGGNMFCMAKPPPGRDSYSIGIRNPRAKEYQTILGSVAILNQSVAGSGDYERFAEVGGRRVCHIMDPRTGHPVKGVAHVSVVAKSALAADTLSTAAFVSQGSNLDALAEIDPAAQFFIVHINPDDSLSTVTRGDLWQALTIEGVTNGTVE